MSKDYMREYSRAYRKEGFGRLSDRRYYLAHRDEILAKQRLRDAARAIYRKKLRNACEDE